jgi:hypothetical protein
MALPRGGWSLNLNGVQSGMLLSEDAADGTLSATIFGVPLKGFWNESTQTLVFAGGEPNSFVPVPHVGTFIGHLLRTPLDAVPGQDVVATLVGYVQVTTPSAGLAGSFGMIAGSQRRNVFGWFANRTEVI